MTTSRAHFLTCAMLVAAAVIGASATREGDIMSLQPNSDIGKKARVSSPEHAEFELSGLHTPLDCTFDLGKCQVAVRYKASANHTGDVAKPIGVSVTVRACKNKITKTNMHNTETCEFHVNKNCDTSLMPDQRFWCESQVMTDENSTGVWQPPENMVHAPAHLWPDNTTSILVPFTWIKPEGGADSSTLPLGVEKGSVEERWGVELGSNGGYRPLVVPTWGPTVVSKQDAAGTLQVLIRVPSALDDLLKGAFYQVCFRPEDAYNCYDLVCTDRLKICKSAGSKADCEIGSKDAGKIAGTSLALLFAAAAVAANSA